MAARIRDLLSNINIPDLNLPRIGWVDVVDILIVTYIVFFIMQWIRQTRAWSLIKGVVFILVVASIAWLFNLVTVLWILQNAFAMGLILVAILFQPELRKALEQIGKGRFLSSLVKGESESMRISMYTVNEMVKAIKIMANSKTGAIVVIERKVPLGDHELSGVPMDAVISSQLLLNIFEKNTPLHDGAVIVRNNRVMAAACILPLTSEKIDMDLGTRHRAAIGISEVSDALVLVTSEESGFISIAEGSKLTINLTEEELRERLLTVLMNETQSKGIMISVRKRKSK